MFIATWNNVEIARHNQAVSLEGSLYFPPHVVRTDLFKPSEETSYCEWKEASAEYFDIEAGNEVNSAAVWRYASPKPNLNAIAGYYSFWRGVEVEWVGEGNPDTIELAHDMPNVAKALGASKVSWRAKPSFWNEDAQFNGYLIPDKNIAVDVLSDPGPATRGDVIALARARAIRCAEYSASQISAGNQGHAYIAVWGSTPPSEVAIKALQQNRSVVELSKENTEEFAAAS